jgi:mRNA-degrading endonuclease toxin of MazEF toxin-antitoxin module
MPRPGEVFYLPPEASEGPGKGDRPHLLLSRVGEDTEVATFAYGSTRDTDAVRGAEYVRVVPGRGTGLAHLTYVYTSRLVSYAASAMGSSSGRVVHELPAIRDSLRRALGTGTGVTAERNVPGSNRRGRVVELVPDLATAWDTRYAVVVTEPRYSRTGYQQVVVPALDEACEERSLDVVTEGLSELGQGYHTAIIAAPMVSTLCLPDHISRFMDVVVSTETMARLEAALAAHFGLAS